MNLQRITAVLALLAALAGCGKSDEELARQWEVVHAQTFRAGLKILCPLKTCGFDSLQTVVGRDGLGEAGFNVGEGI